MKKQIIKKNYTVSTDDRFYGSAEERLYQASMPSAESVLTEFGNGPYGYNEDQVDEARAFYGKNEVEQGKKTTLLRRLFGSFVNPFTAVLLVLAGISVFTDIVMAAPADKSPITVILTEELGADEA
jgi:P-type Mg2+ transporter